MARDVLNISGGSFKKIFIFRYRVGVPSPGHFYKTVLNFLFNFLTFPVNECKC